MPEGKTLETVSDPAAMFATTGLNAGENERDADQAGDIDPQAPLQTRARRFVRVSRSVWLTRAE